MVDLQLSGLAACELSSWELRYKCDHDQNTSETLEIGSSNSSIFSLGELGGLPTGSNLQLTRSGTQTLQGFPTQSPWPGDPGQACPETAGTSVV